MGENVLACIIKAARFVDTGPFMHMLVYLHSVACFLPSGPRDSPSAYKQIGSSFYVERFMIDYLNT